MADSALSQAPSIRVSGLARLLPRALKVLAVVAVLGLVAGVAYYTLGSSSPRSAADRYLAAIQAGNAGSAWSEVQVDAVGSADARLIDQAAMAAALKTSRPTLSGLQFVSANPFLNGQDVEYTYGKAPGLQHLGLFVTKESSRSHLFVNPGWTVHLVPIVVTVLVPGASGGLTVDGVRVQVPTDKAAAVAVLPLPHRFSVAGSPLVQTASVDFNGIGAGRTANVSLHASATPAALAQVEAAGKNVFTACGSSLQQALSTCYGLFQGLRAGADSWSIVNGPTVTSLAYDNGSWTGVGRVMAIGTYHMTGETIARHELLAAPVTLKVALGPSVHVIELTEGGTVPPIERPSGASDSAATDLVRSAFAVCAAATVLDPPDCPNSHTSYLQVSNVSWRLQGDALQGANVSWDGATGVLHVTGKYSMMASYDYNGFVVEHDQSPSDSSSYDAQLVWDGSALKLVAVDPA